MGRRALWFRKTFAGSWKATDWTTANILYRRPDRPWLLQTYVWQDYDLCPMFAHLNQYIPTALTNACFEGVVSTGPVTGRRNTCAISFCWRFNSQGFTWPFVELTHHLV
jgi:uncharacterized protein Usg